MNRPSFMTYRRSGGAFSQSSGRFLPGCGHAGHSTGPELHEPVEALEGGVDEEGRDKEDGLSLSSYVPMSIVRQGKGGVCHARFETLQMAACE